MVNALPSASAVAIIELAKKTDKQAATVLKAWLDSGLLTEANYKTPTRNGQSPRRHRRIGRHHVDKRHYCRDMRACQWCAPSYRKPRAAWEMTMILNY